MRAKSWKTTLILLVSAVPAWAGAGNESGGGLLATVFLAFFGLIVVVQLIPGIALFLTMVKGLFAPAPEPMPVETPAPEGTNG